MGFIPISRKDLESAYGVILETISPHGGFPFFGTLLGLFRDGKLIDGDDDLDFAMETARLKIFTNEIRDNSRFLIHSTSFCLNQLVQVTYSYRLSDTKSVLCDVYGYMSKNGEIIFPVHWRDETENPGNWLRVPWDKSTQFELNNFLETKDARPLEFEPLVTLIQFLYGEKWSTKLIKNVDYRVDLQEGKPNYTYFSRFQRTRLKATYRVLWWLGEREKHPGVKIIRKFASLLPLSVKNYFFRH